MYDNKPSRHPLLAQVPLAVSPFISLPSAPTLPYTYKPLPSTLPTSSTADQSGQEREKYVLSPSGHASSPSEIIASCSAIQSHIETTHTNALKEVQDWEEKLKGEELAEKRRVAPGWLDREEKLLEPKRASIASTSGKGDGGEEGSNLMDRQEEEQTVAAEQGGGLGGEELDRAFGGMGQGIK